MNARRGQPAKRKSHRRTSRQNGGSPRNPSKVSSSNWLSFQAAFEQLRDRAGSSKNAESDFEAILQSGVPSLELKVSFNGKKTRCVRLADFWKDLAYPWVETDVSGADHLRVHYTEYDPSMPAEPGKFFVRKADFERELERLYPTILYPTTAAPPPAPSKKKRRKAKQASRAGAPEQHDWEEGELFAMQELKSRGSPLDKNNQTKGWKTISDVARLVIDHLEKLSEDGVGPDMSRRCTSGL